MATARIIRLDPTHRPVYAVDRLSGESAEKASELLNLNHKQHNIFFNEDGFHNHIVHHILTIYALGATTEELQKAYDTNAHYQLPLSNYDENVVKSIRDAASPDKVLEMDDRVSVAENYANYLEFFTREIEAKGHEKVINEYLFSRDKRAEDMFVRLHAGFLHPLIHLGFALEFDQPAIIAEALAQTVAHDSWIGQLLYGAEDSAKANSRPSSKTLNSLLEDIRRNDKLVKSPQWADGNKVRDGILRRAPQEMIEAASRYRVKDVSELHTKMAEMMNFALYFTVAAQKPPHIPKVDFYYMHSANSSIFFPTLMNLSYITDDSKMRLLEWKVRTDLALYVSRASPQLLLDEVINFVPDDHEGDGWENWIRRINALEDDGHASKLIRAIAAAKKICTTGEVASKTASDGFVLRGEAFDKAAELVVHSVHKPGDTWIRSCGFEEAWKDVPIRQNRAQKI